MTKSFNELAGELKAFIVEEHSNYRGIKNISLQRYNNLRVNMNTSIHAMPHVIIRIGMSEGACSLPHGTRIVGGLGMYECKPNIVTDLDSQWRMAQLHSA